MLGVSELVGTARVAGVAAGRNTALRVDRTPEGWEGGRVMKSSKKRWFTPEEDAFLLENVGKLSYSQIARELGRRPSTIYNRYRKLVVGDVCENRRQWTPEEDEIVREMLLNGHSYADIAKCLGRTEN